MSAKEAAMEVIRAMPDQASLREIITALEEARATEEALRRFDERGGIPDEDLTDEEWMATISRSLADDLNDPRQDIYPLEDDGGHANEAR
jgi:hypothetical protein